MSKSGYLLIFLLGFFSCALIITAFFLITDAPLTGQAIQNPEASSPSNHIENQDIIVLNDRVIIFVENPTLSTYTPTGSMKPSLDQGANGIRIKPTSPDQVSVGDIITFRYQGQLIVHRVIEKETDNQEIYFITKGDNSPSADNKIRFEDIEYKTIGVIY
jgi:signal peptidase I